MPEILEEFTDHFDRFMSWAYESVYGTVGGGYDQGGFPPGHWNDGAYGVTTLVPGGETHYLHVLISPQGNRLAVPDAGYDVTNAVNLKTGETFLIKQAGGRLKIEVPSWEATECDGDILFVLPRVRVIPPQQVTVTASSELPYCPAANVLDGKYHTCFRGVTARGWPQNLTIKLAREYELTGLCVTQPETGAVREGGYAAPLGKCIKEYEVRTSRDGIHWSEPVAYGELRNQRGMQVILFPPVFALHVQFTAMSNHGGTDTFQVIGIEILVP